MVFNNVLDLIGNTPVLKISNVDAGERGDVFLKLEKYNPAGSIKDRAALGMIERAEKDGKIKPGDTLVEPTSGNMGIGIAMIGKIKGYKVVIVMPESMSKERRSLVKAYGAELVLTEGSKGMKGAIAKAEELVKEKGYFMPQQFTNPANPEKHYETTAAEILKDIPDSDVFVAGVGTGGTISGIGKKLKEMKSDITIIAVEPANSPVLSGGTPGAHKIQGIGAGFVPEIYDKNVVDKVMQITDDEAYEGAREIASKEGVLVGISAGAALMAALKTAKEIGKGKKVLAIAPDGGEKYISMGLYD